MKAIRSNKTLMTIGLVTLAAGALAYPAVLLYRSLSKRRKQQADTEGLVEDTHAKAFVPAYRGNHKPHHRKAESNGHMQAANHSH